MAQVEPVKMHFIFTFLRFLSFFSFYVYFVVFFVYFDKCVFIVIVGEQMKRFSQVSIALYNNWSSPEPRTETNLTSINISRRVRVLIIQYFHNNLYFCSAFAMRSNYPTFLRVSLPPPPHQTRPFNLLIILGLV